MRNRNMKCKDMMCGADDCDRCHPGCHDEIHCVNECGNFVFAYEADRFCRDCEEFVCIECGLDYGRCKSCYADYLEDL